MKNPNIDFVYFDLGQVLVSIENRWPLFVKNMKWTPEQATLFKDIWWKYSDRMCADYSLQTEFLDSVRAAGILIEDPFDINEVSIDMFEVIDPMQRLAEEVAIHYPAGLLTNAYQGMVKRLVEVEKMPKAAWKTIVDSSEIKAIKPHPEIYHVAQERAGVPANNILFIDNSVPNVEMAKNLGWQVYLFNENDTLSHVTKLKELLLS